MMFQQAREIKGYLILNKFHHHLFVQRSVRRPHISHSESEWLSMSSKHVELARAINSSRMQDATETIALVAWLLITLVPRARMRAECMLNSNVKFSLKFQSLPTKRNIDVPILWVLDNVALCAHFSFAVFPKETQCSLVFKTTNISWQISWLQKHGLSSLCQMKGFQVISRKLV